MKYIEISKKEIFNDYETMKTDDICKKYGICSDRLYRILDELQIPRKIKRKSPTFINVIIKE